MDNYGGGTNNYSDQTSEVFYSEVVPGTRETVRFRLVAAMESLGYDIIEDEPMITGRRNSRGWATWYSSADVLEYAAMLTVRLRNVGSGAVRVSFDYKIKHGWINDGEKEVVIQEAKTLSGLAKISAIDKLCSVCETESTDDSRFCRNCGAPLTSESSELEVLRLMAETRAAKTSVVTSALFTTFLTVYMPLIAFLAVFDLMTPRKLALLLGGGVLLMAFTLLCNLFGWNRLKRALKTPETSKKPAYRKQTNEFMVQEDAVSLPPARPFASVTEGTTNLLDPEEVTIKEREQIPVLKPRVTRDLD